MAGVKESLSPLDTNSSGKFSLPQFCRMLGMPPFAELTQADLRLKVTNAIVIACRRARGGPVAAFADLFLNKAQEWFNILDPEGGDALDAHELGVLIRKLQQLQGKELEVDLWSFEQQMHQAVDKYGDGELLSFGQMIGMLATKPWIVSLVSSACDCLLSLFGTKNSYDL